MVNNFSREYPENPLIYLAYSCSTRVNRIDISLIRYRLRKLGIFLGPLRSLQLQTMQSSQLFQLVGLLGLRRDCSRSFFNRLKSLRIILKKNSRVDYNWRITARFQFHGYGAPGVSGRVQNENRLSSQPDRSFTDGCPYSHKCRYIYSESSLHSKCPSRICIITSRPHVGGSHRISWWRFPGKHSWCLECRLDIQHSSGVSCWGRLAWHPRFMGWRLGWLVFRFSFRIGIHTLELIPHF